MGYQHTDGGSGDSYNRALQGPPGYRVCSRVVPTHSKVAEAFMFLHHYLLVKDHGTAGFGNRTCILRHFPFPCLPVKQAVVALSEKILRCWLLKVKAREHTK